MHVFKKQGRTDALVGMNAPTKVKAGDDFDVTIFRQKKGTALNGELHFVSLGGLDDVGPVKQSFTIGDKDISVTVKTGKTVAGKANRGLMLVAKTDTHYVTTVLRLM